MFRNNSKQYQIESEWIKKIQRGESGAFEDLFNKYCQALISFAWRYVKDTQIAENTVQDVFLKIWLSRQKLNPSLKIKSYLYKAVKNQALKHLRHTKIAHRSLADIQTLNTSIKSPDDELNEKEIAILVQRAVEELPEKCRLIFTLKKYDHLTYSEIAEIQNISIKTVETQMCRALKFLRKRLANLTFILL